MAEPAVKPMSLAEFLRWDDGSDTHYELNGGFPLAMAPPAAAHRMLRGRAWNRKSKHWNRGGPATRKAIAADRLSRAFG